MDNLAELFNAFYTHFVLRDLLAKITPGAIVLIAISTIFIWQPDDVAHYIAELTFWSWTIFLAFSWITGITLQSIGEWLAEITKGKFGVQSFPKECEGVEEWFEFRVKFSHSGRAKGEDKNRVERYSVIKEASGIGSIAFLIVFFLLLVKIILLLEISNFQFIPVLGGYDNIGILIMGLIIAIIFVYFLQCWHKIQRQRQYKYMRVTMDC